MDKTFFIKQIEDIQKDYNQILNKATFDDLSGNVTIEEKTNVITRIKVIIVRIVGADSEYYKECVRVLEKTTITLGVKLRNVIGILNGLKHDIENDYLKSLSDIIHADVFSDYLEMAEHLLKEGYKNPSAVLIGSTLESNLKELCLQNDIEIETENNKGKLVPKKADLLNIELAKSQIYSTIYQKQITAWLGIRNSAAHGNFDDYTNEEVNLMLSGVRLFILKFL